MNALRLTSINGDCAGRTVISVGNVKFGDDFVVIAGPCSVESEEQTVKTAQEVKKAGANMLRGGAFKPRTSPKSFQGLGIEGLELMKEAAEKYDMFVVSEILDAEHIDCCYDLIDMIQIGSRSMFSSPLLKQIGKRSASDKKPILLKRAFNATINELIYASQYIRDEGNDNVWLCLRGIRTFEQIDSSLRFTPDLAGIIEIKEKSDLPVIFDPSHSSGHSRYIGKISHAALNLGADGLIIEVHDKPEEALSDGIQSILPEELGDILKNIGSPGLNKK